MLFSITNQKDTHYIKEFVNKLEARHYVIDRLDLSQKWVITPYISIFTNNQKMFLLEAIKEQDRFLQSIPDFSPEYYKDKSEIFEQLKKLI